jgi:hypothetical protein
MVPGRLPESYWPGLLSGNSSLYASPPLHYGAKDQLLYFFV